MGTKITFELNARKVSETETAALGAWIWVLCVKENQGCGDLFDLFYLFLFNFGCWFGTLTHRAPVCAGPYAKVWLAIQQQQIAELGLQRAAQISWTISSVL